jgi:hypothetical protein
MSWIGIASAFHEEETYVSTLCNGHTDTFMRVTTAQEDNCYHMLSSTGNGQRGRVVNSE